MSVQWSSSVLQPVLRPLSLPDHITWSQSKIFSIIIIYLTSPATYIYIYIYCLTGGLNIEGLL